MDEIAKSRESIYSRYHRHAKNKFLKNIFLDFHKSEFFEI